MRYLIENDILYNPLDGSLADVTLPEEPHTVLTPMSNNVLLLLIEKRGSVVSRDDFINKVWVENGLVGSVHTLNQYLSNLRKLFHLYLGERDVIVTVPKQGYMIAREIVITEIEDEPLIQTPLLSQTSPDKSEERHSIRPTPVPGRKYAAIGLLLTLILLAGVAGIMLHNNRFQAADVYAIGSIGQCPLFSFKKTSSPDYINKEREVAEAISREEGLHCLTHGAFYIAIDESMLSGVPSKVMLSRCIEGPRDNDICTSAHYSRW